MSNVGRSVRTNHHFAINPSQIIYGDINEGISIYICRKEFRAGQISRIRAQIRRKVFFFSEWGKFNLGFPYDCGAKKRALGQKVGNSGYDPKLPTF
jgi:hypothetical protein